MKQHASRLSRTFAAIILVAHLVAGCGTKPDASGAAAGAGEIAPLALGTHTYGITTSSPEAQQAFDRGLTLAYGFAHQAAEKEFRRAAELDPRCAMAWWGIALVHGPHINLPLVTPERATAAWEALSRAQALSQGAGETERALIAALGRRYVEHQPEDRRHLDEAYALAMREVWRKYPGDADVASLFAEAMMDLRPWDLWTADGKPQPGTAEILATLERALEINPDHPGANHYYIHVVEASNSPERGVAAADRLLGLVPGASHLVHMPAHIYARVGRWEDAADANVRAIGADAAFRKANPRPGFYAMYMAHNQHFLAYALMMQGRSAQALEAARSMVASVPEEFLQEFAGVADGYMVIVPEVLMRFGRWKEILAEPEPRESLPLARSLWRYMRSVSLTALGRLEEAEKEREAFRLAAAAVPKDRTFGNNPAGLLLEIAARMLDGEMAAKRGRFDESVRTLREAARIEDSLRYDEPPDWIQPVRHTLGAVLMTAGRYADAERVYREDLAKFPENGWSLFGLGRALRLQKKDVEASAAEERFRKIWAGADVRLGSTCYCLPGA